MATRYVGFSCTILYERLYSLIFFTPFWVAHLIVLLPRYLHRDTSVCLSIIYQLLLPMLATIHFFSSVCFPQICCLINCAYRGIVLDIPKCLIHSFPIRLRFDLHFTVCIVTVRWHRIFRDVSVNEGLGMEIRRLFN